MIGVIVLFLSIYGFSSTLSSPIGGELCYPDLSNFKLVDQSSDVQECAKGIWYPIKTSFTSDVLQPNEQIDTSTSKALEQSNVFYCDEYYLLAHGCRKFLGSKFETAFILSKTKLADPYAIRYMEEILHRNKVQIKLYSVKGVYEKLLENDKGLLQAANNNKRHLSQLLYNFRKLEKSQPLTEDELFVNCIQILMRANVEDFAYCFWMY